MVDFSKALNLVLRWFYRVIEVVRYIFRQKTEKKIFWNSRKNEFDGDFSCFFAIKVSAIPRHLSKLVQMMRLVPLNSQICLDSLALAGKKKLWIFENRKNGLFKDGVFCATITHPPDDRFLHMIGHSNRN